MNKHTNTLSSKRLACLFGSMFTLTTLVPLCLYAQEGKNNDLIASDLKLIDQYVESIGNNTICFDKSNIKQFWIDNSVVSRKDSFEISLNDKNESVPLRVRLANVNETLDCNVVVISDTSSLEFDILNDKKEIISSSKEEDQLIKYNVSSSRFHLEDTLSYGFYIRFKTKTENTVSIRKIVLSFSNNKNCSFLSSPGTLRITPDIIQNVLRSKIIAEKPNSFSVSAKRTELLSSKKIYVTTNHLQTTVTIKNIGDTPTSVYVGYAPYTLDHQRIQKKNSPYKEGKILKVLESQANSNKVLVDSYAEWEKGCFLALNAKEDLSDFPNYSIIDSPIVDMKKIDDSHAEIVFERPLQKGIEKGIQVRIQSPIGESYLYKNIQTLQPGEEVTFQSTIHKDDNFLAYSPWALCRGTYYVVPLILSYSVDRDKENTILITDFTVSY